MLNSPLPTKRKIYTHAPNLTYLLPVAHALPVLGQQRKLRLRHLSSGLGRLWLEGGWGNAAGGRGAGGCWTGVIMVVVVCWVMLWSWRGYPTKRRQSPFPPTQTKLTRAVRLLQRALHPEARLHLALEEEGLLQGPEQDLHLLHLRAARCFGVVGGWVFKGGVRGGWEYLRPRYNKLRYMLYSIHRREPPTLQRLEDVLARLLEEGHEQALRHAPVRGEDALEAVLLVCVWLGGWGDWLGVYVGTHIPFHPCGAAHTGGTPIHTYIRSIQPHTHQHTLHPPTYRSSTALSVRRNHAKRRSTCSRPENSPFGGKASA